MAARKKAAAKKPPLTVVAAVERDLRVLARLDKGLAESPEAAAALALARELDNPGNSATSKSMCAKQLLECLEALRARAPEGKEDDPLDQLAARRAARLAARGAAA